MPIRTRTLLFEASLLALMYVGPTTAQDQSIATTPCAVETGTLDPSTLDADGAAAPALLIAARDAWNSGDPEAIAALFVEDGDVIGGAGTHTHGRTEIARYFENLMTTLGPGAVYTNKIKSVRFVTPDVAIVHALGGFLKPGDKELSSDRCGIQMMVAVLDGGAWRIASVQATRIGPVR
jgi:uncharacterized protein (TIGR02246 family)